MIFQQITRQETPYGEVFITESNEGFWLGVFAYFTTYIIPILTIVIILFFLIKFFKMFKKMNNTLLEINENLKKK